MANRSNNVERMHGIAIEAPRVQLQREAEVKQKEWFANPESAACKESYGKALLRWAVETKNKSAKDHANKILNNEV